MKKLLILGILWLGVSGIRLSYGQNTVYSYQDGNADSLSTWSVYYPLTDSTDTLIHQFPTVNDAVVVYHNISITSRHQYAYLYVYARVTVDPTDTLSATTLDVSYGGTLRILGTVAVSILRGAPYSASITGTGKLITVGSIIQPPALIDSVSLYILQSCDLWSNLILGSRAKVQIGDATHAVIVTMGTYYITGTPVVPVIIYQSLANPSGIVTGFGEISGPTGALRCPFVAGVFSAWGFSLNAYNPSTLPTRMAQFLIPHSGGGNYSVTLNKDIIVFNKLEMGTYPFGRLKTTKSIYLKDTLGYYPTYGMGWMNGTLVRDLDQGVSTNNLYFPLGDSRDPYPITLMFPGVFPTQGKVAVTFDKSASFSQPACIINQIPVNQLLDYNYWKIVLSDTSLVYNMLLQRPSAPLYTPFFVIKKPVVGTGGWTSGGTEPLGYNKYFAQFIPTNLRAGKMNVVGNGIFMVAKNETILAIDTTRKTPFHENKKEALSIRLYPNPAEDNINLELEQMSDLAIYDMVGNCVYRAYELEEGVRSIDISRFVSGRYIVKIQPLLRNPQEISFVKASSQ
jgi:hypothetical protein